MINESRGAFDANGRIHVGATSFIGTPPPVVFDGNIIIQDDGAGNGGSLNDAIKVVGCHATDDPLDICVCGTNQGTIAITQPNCANQVVAACVTGCWDQ